MVIAKCDVVFLKKIVIKNIKDEITFIILFILLVRYKTMSAVNLTPARSGSILRDIDYKKLLKKRVPILTWLPAYSISKFLYDVLAGFSVSLTQVPQAIAYGVVAGLGPQYGLYAAFMGCFVYAILGSCKDVTFGPTAIMAVMIQPHVVKLGPDAAILLTFLKGCIVFVLGVCNLGFVVQFFSYPVIAGFTSAAAVQIGSTQLNSLFGIPRRASDFLEALEVFFTHLHEITLWNSLMGWICIVVLLSTKQLSRFGSLKHNPNWSTSRNCFGRCLWLLSLARNALVVVVCTLIALLFDRNGYEPFTLTGNMTQGLPPFKPPVFTITHDNVTYSFGEILSSFGTSTAFVPLISILEVIAIAKAFAKGKSVDATQEMLALGVTNILGSFVSSMPMTGSFTRTAVNNASGVQTQLGGTITGTIVLLALVLLTSSFYYIPKATLAAVIICAMINLFEAEAVPFLWKTKKLDLIPFFVTLLACLFLGLEYGILIGIGTSLMFVLYASLRPPVAIDIERLRENKIFVVTPSRGLQFPAAEYVRHLVMKKCNGFESIVIINGKYINAIDATVAKNFKTLAVDLSLRDQNVIFWNFKSSVKEICCGVSVDMFQRFRDGDLEDLIDNLGNSSTAEENKVDRP